jgi:hypothetical protein
VRRQKSVRTTISDPAAVRPPDLVDRQFGVPAPIRLSHTWWVCQVGRMLRALIAVQKVLTAPLQGLAQRHS